MRSPLTAESDNSDADAVARSNRRTHQCCAGRRGTHYEMSSIH
jgi:hypothetical protein